MIAELSTITRNQIGFAVIVFWILLHRVLVAIVTQPKVRRPGR